MNVVESEYWAKMNVIFFKASITSPSNRLLFPSPSKNCLVQLRKYFSILVVDPDPRVVSLVSLCHSFEVFVLLGLLSSFDLAKRLINFSYALSIVLSTFSTSPVVVGGLYMSIDWAS